MVYTLYYIDGMTLLHTAAATKPNIKKREREKSPKCWLTASSLIYYYSRDAISIPPTDWHWIQPIPYIAKAAAAAAPISISHMCATETLSRLYTQQSFSLRSYFFLSCCDAAAVVLCRLSPVPRSILCVLLYQLYYKEPLSLSLSQPLSASHLVCQLALEIGDTYSTHCA